MSEVENLIQAISDKNFSAATEIFNDQIGQRMASALDQEKIGIADAVYNGVQAAADDDQQDIDDDDTDVDIDDIMADVTDEDLNDDDDLEN